MPLSVVYLKTAGNYMAIIPLGESNRADRIETLCQERGGGGGGIRKEKQYVLPGDGERKARGALPDDLSVVFNG